MRVLLGPATVNVVTARDGFQDVNGVHRLFGFAVRVHLSNELAHREGERNLLALPRVRRGLDRLQSLHVEQEVLANAARCGKDL